MADICQLTATEVLERYTKGPYTVQQYASSLLERIKRDDGITKAWVYLDPEQVLAQAKRLDEIPQNQRGPLHGVAIAIKDVMHTKDMPTQHGSPIYRDQHTTFDAASVAMLRHAGALILGKTSTTEFAASKVGPATTNPHDAARSPGGSSSGSAAAVAALHCPLALGTQTGGSIVRPASYCGIYGFKPTWNAVSREGLKIHSLLMDTIGFFARSVDDLALLAAVFGVQDDVLPRALPTGLQGVRLAYCETPVWEQAGPGTRTAMAQGVARLRAAGVEVEQIRLPEEFDDITDLHACVTAWDARVSFRLEYVQAKDQIDPAVVDLIENKAGYTRRDYTDAVDRIAALRPQWDAIAERYAAVIVPSATDEAPEGLGDTGSHIFNRIWTALHSPVINIPAFHGEHAMPIGLSLTTARFKDQALLAVAKEVSKVWRETASFVKTT